MPADSASMAIISARSIPIRFAAWAKGENAAKAKSGRLLSSPAAVADRPRSWRIMSISGPTPVSAGLEIGGDHHERRE